MSRLSRLKLSARPCNFSLNPDAARPVERPWRIRRDFRDKGGDGATFQTKVETARLSRQMRRLEQSWNLPAYVQIRLRLGREELILGCAVSALFSKDAPSPPWSGKSCRLRLGREELILDRTFSSMVWKIAPSPPWYGKSRRFHHGREELFLGRAVSASVWKNAPSPPWYGKSRHLHHGLESRAFSTLNVKVAQLGREMHGKW